ncbi:MAG: hypothetical protein QM477_09185 [Planctomycetota bacterium]
MFLLLSLGAGGVYLAQQRETLVFMSTAEIHVERTFQRVLSVDREELRNTQEYDIFRNEQIGLMLRPDVLEDALRRCNQLDNGTWAPAELGPAASIGVFRDSLDIYLLSRSYRIAVDLVGYNSRALQPALNALLEAFVDAHNREFSFANDDRPASLREILGVLDGEIKIKRGKVKALAEQLNVLNFQDSRVNPWLNPLENARLAQVEASRKERQIRREVEEAGEPTIDPADLDLVLLGGAEAIGESLALMVSPLVEERSSLLGRLLNMGPGHPARADLEKRVAGIETQIQDILQRQAKVDRATMAKNLRQAQIRNTQLDEEVAELESRARNFVTAFQDGVVVETSLLGELERRKQIVARLSHFEIEAKSPSYVRVALAASQVDPRGQSNLTRNYGIVGILAFLIAFGIPILLEIRDQRIHTTTDVHDVLGFAPAIWVPQKKSESQILLAADQIRRFALALDRDQSYARSRLILFADVKPTKGTQETIEEIAQALAGLGRKILVVDAMNPRGLGLKKAYATSGFLGLLAGKGLQVLSRDGWDFLEYGNPKIEVGHNLSGWNGILRAATQDYDMVLIKGGPLLASPDAEHMASSADLVVLVVEAEVQLRGEVHRAGDVLASIQPASVGSILINAKVFSGHGYYQDLVKERKALSAGST